MIIQGHNTDRCSTQCTLKAIRFHKHNRLCSAWEHGSGRWVTGHSLHFPLFLSTSTLHSQWMSVSFYVCTAACGYTLHPAHWVVHSWVKLAHFLWTVPSGAFSPRTEGLWLSMTDVFSSTSVLVCRCPRASLKDRSGCLLMWPRHCCRNIS